MTVFAYILSSSIFSSLFYVLSTSTLRQQSSKVVVSPLLVLGITHFVAGAILFPFALTPLSTQVDPGYLALSCAGLAALQLTARYFHLKALSLADVAVVTPYAGFMPVLTLAVAWFFLGEIPSGLAFFGIFLVSGAVFASAFTEKEPEVERESKSIFFYARVLAFLAAVPPAFRIVFQKNVLLNSDPLSLSCLMLLVTGFAALVLSFLGSRESARAWCPPPAVLLKLSVLSTLLSLNIYLFTCALTVGLAANVSAMARMTIVFQIIFAYFLVGQRKRLLTRLLWGVVVFVGTLLIAAGEFFTS